MKQIFFRILIVGLMLSTATFGAIIDNFDVTQVLGTGVIGTVDGGVIAAGAFGGARYMSLTNGTGGGNTSLNSNQAGSSLLEYGNEPAVGGSFFVQWDGDTDSTLEFGNTTGDLTDLGVSNLLRISYRADLIIPITVIVYSTATDYSTATFNTTSTGFGANPFATVDLLFSNFVATGLGANFANVVAVTLAGSSATQPGADLQIEFIETTTNGEIPEPATYALIGAGLLGFTLLRRRKA